MYFERNVKIASTVVGGRKFLWQYFCNGDDNDNDSNDSDDVDGCDDFDDGDDDGDALDDGDVLLDSACNALYVFPDKTLRAQSENQSPRWCYQTKEKRDFFRSKIWREKSLGRKYIIKAYLLLKKILKLKEYWKKYVDTWITLIKVINATIHQLTIQCWLG